MKKMKTAVPALMTRVGLVIAILVAAQWTAPLAQAQGAAAQAPLRFVGTITAISGSTLTVKTDGDGERQVEVPATAALKRIAPGQKDLSTADTIDRKST